VSQAGSNSGGGGGGSSILQVTTDAGIATPIAGNINLNGDGVHITTSAVTDTITITGNGIITIDGDTGSITGTTVAFNANATDRAGNSISFVSNSPTQMVLQMTDSLQNTLIGNTSGNGGITGTQNTALGQSTLQNITTDHDCVAVGFEALSVLDGSGGVNTAIGSLCMQNLVSGEANTAAGYFALNASQTGSNNTAMGFQCLASSTGDNSNTAYGFNAGNHINGGNQNTIIGLDALFTATTASNNVCLGYESAFSLATGVDNIAIGFLSGGSWTTNESDNICIGSVGVVGDQNTIRIGTQGSGGFEQNQCFIAGIAGVTVSNQQFVTIDTTTGQLGSVAGGGGGGITTIDGNTGSATGATVTFQGTEGLSGGSVTFIASGSQVSLSLSDAQASTYLGNGAGNSTSTSVVGSNTAVGQVAMQAITSGGANSAYGGGSLDALLTGNYNTCLGYNSGGAYTGAESSNIAIGYGAGGVNGESNTLRIGNGTGTGNGQINQSFVAGIQGITVTGTAVLVSTSDQLGIAVSSRKYKENIVDMGSASDDIYKLRPVTFTLKDNQDQSIQYGLIAEEVAEVMPNIVVMDKEGNPQTVQYHNLPALLLNEIQKLRKEIDDIKQKIKQ